MGKVVISLHRNETRAGSPDAKYEKTFLKMYALCGHTEIITQSHEIGKIQPNHSYESDDSTKLKLLKINSKIINLKN